MLKVNGKLSEEYNRILRNEALLSENVWDLTPLSFSRIHGITIQLLETALSSRILRSFYHVYDHSEMDFAEESVGAHTNLMATLADRAFFTFFDEEEKIYPAECSYRVYMEAARRHDLPENVIGDIPDNGERDDKLKAMEEYKYFEEFSEFSPESDRKFEESVNKLLHSMNDRATLLGKMLYMADKTSAVVQVLAEDFAKNSPLMRWGSPKASEFDRKNMEYCDNCINGYFKASEMWTISFLKTRKMSKYDDTGFFTAVIIMTTLIVNHAWYNWREKDYENI